MIYDLDNVRISPRIYQTWLAYLPQSVSDLQRRFKNLKPSEIPDEQFRLLPDGSGEIFVTIRKKELKLSVPKGEFVIC